MGTGMTNEEVNAFFNIGEECVEFYKQEHKGVEIRIYRKGNPYSPIGATYAMELIVDFDLDEWRKNYTLMDEEQIVFWTNKKIKQHEK